MGRTALPWKMAIFALLWLSQKIRSFLASFDNDGHSIVYNRIVKGLRSVLLPLPPRPNRAWIEWVLWTAHLGLYFSVLWRLQCKQYPFLLLGVTYEYWLIISYRSASLYGVTSVQAFLYFSDYKQDGRWIRSTVRSIRQMPLFLHMDKTTHLGDAPLVREFSVTRQLLYCHFFRILDTIQIALIVHALYSYLVTSFGNYAVLLSPTWYALPNQWSCLSTWRFPGWLRSMLAQIYVTTFSNMIVRGWVVQYSDIACESLKTYLKDFLPGEYQSVGLLLCQTVPRQ